MPKIIDLTHALDPNKEQRKFSIETIGAETINKNVVRLKDQWYIMTNISMVSHIGTHIEVPYHIFPDGHDLATMPLESYFGDAVLLDFSKIQARIAISKQQVIDECARVGGVNKGDIVVCNLGYAHLYGQDGYGQSPYFATDAIQWLASSGMKLMAIDAGGVELPASEEHVNHTALFENNIPLIENIANLNSLTKTRFKLYAFPIAIVGVESFPVRVVAIE